MLRKEKLLYFCLCFFCSVIVLKAETERLWIDNDRLQSIKQEIQEDGSVLQKAFLIMKDRIDAADGDTVDWTIYGGSWESDNWNYYRNRLAREASMLYLLTDSLKYADIAYRVLYDVHADPDPDGRLPESGYGLARATVGMGFAIAYNWCYDAWDESQRTYIRDKIVLALDAWPSYNHVNLNTFDKGSNWVAVCRSGELIMMLVTGEEQYRTERYEYLNMALLRHIQNAYGDKGFCQEGNGYIGYPAPFLFPAVYASAHRGDSTLLEELNQHRFWEILSYTSAFSFFKEDSLLPYFTKANNFGVGSNTFNQEGFKNLLFNTVQDDELQYYKYIYDRQEGFLSGRPDTQLFDHTRAGMLWLFAYYPLEHEAVSPQGNMPSGMVDSSYGYAVFRNQWKDSNDIVFTMVGDNRYYGRAWDQPEATQITLTANNTIFFSGPGKKTDRDSYSTLQIDNKGDNSASRTTGHLVMSDMHEHGGYAIVDGFKKYRDLGLSNNQRHALVHYPAGESNALISIMDQVKSENNHILSFNLYLGHWLQEDSIPVVIEEDNGIPSFLIQGEENAYLKAWVINPAEVDIETNGVYLRVSTQQPVSADSLWIVMLADTGEPTSIVVEQQGLQALVHIMDTTLAFSPAQNRMLLGTPHLNSPGHPENLMVELLGEQHVRLTWDANTEIDFAAYRIYRLADVDSPLNPSALIAKGFPSNTFVDKDLQADSSYCYKVVAYDVWGNASDSAATIQITTPQDSFPPEILSVVAYEDNAVEVTFNQPVDSVSAVNMTHYAIDRDIQIMDVQLLVENKVRLIISSLEESIAYTIFIRGLEDFSGNMAEESAHFTYVNGVHITESFECYDPGTLAYQNQGKGWDGAWLYNKAQVMDVSDTVLHAGGIHGGNRALLLAQDDDGIQRYFPNSFIFSLSEYYMSFLLRVSDEITNDLAKVGMYNFSTRPNEYFFGIDQQPEGGQNLLINKFDNEARGQYDFVPGEDVLMVVGIESHRMRLWINPESVTDPPVVSLSESTQQLAGLALYANNAGNAWIDDIYIGSDFKSVLTARQYALLMSPSFLSYTPNRIDDIELHWTDYNDEIDGFYIYRKKVSENDYELIDTTDAHSTSFSDQSDKEHVAYNYVVRAFKGDTLSHYSNRITVDISQYAPHSPVNLVATQISIDQAELTWSDVSDNEDGFVLFISDEMGNLIAFDTLPANTTLYSDSLFANHKLVYYKLISFNAFADSYLSDSVMGVSLNTPEIQSVTYNSGQLALVWDDLSQYEEGYQIERKINDADFELIYTTTENIQVFEEPVIQDDAVYAYRVRAVNSGFFSPYSQTDSVFIPSAVENLILAYKGEGDVTISWNSYTGGAEGFILQLRVDDGDFIMQDSISLDSMTYTDTLLVPEQRYSYRLLSFYGQTHTASIVSDLFIPAPPSDLQATLLDDGIFLDWQNESLETSYFVIERKVNQHDFLAYATVPVDTTSFYDTGLLHDTSYSYRIAAWSETAWSGWVESDTLTYQETSIQSLFVDCCKPLLYPNPASNILHIEWTDHVSCAKYENLRVRIVDLSGKVGYDSKLQSSVDLSSLPDGGYILMMISESKIIYRENIIIQR